ncbi:hypothetical protein GCM10027053_25190 [Intrasporangium mesophilum]
MHTVTKIQSLSPRSRRLGVAAATVLSVAAFTPAVSSGHAYPHVSLGVANSATAVEHQLLSYLDANFSLAGSANAVEHRFLSHLDVAGSANAVEHRFLTYVNAGRGGAGSSSSADNSTAR